MMVRPNICAAALICFVQPVAADYAQIRDQALFALENGDCAKVWDMLWPHAKAGEVQARADLATLPYLRDFHYPGLAGDQISRTRDTLILAVHGAANGDPTAVETARAYLEVSNAGRAVSSCLEGATDPSAAARCVEGAVADGVIPDFPSFALGLDTVATLDAALPARCTP
ncbi:hypothetical protein [Actibacterium sp. 188UL27-1]|uniref:hypothetical protein n=1 Tax=Actibacterium sp. 188UL27-1 TaxID=2786961 RepID=UPI00195D33B3|nr:hypothetical protein [Actibacterium sp. 188UL27-1]MBM7067851.1 hypothetical protein [Actibacterium sp. 188UL27-1]